MSLAISFAAMMSMDFISTTNSTPIPQPAAPFPMSNSIVEIREGTPISVIGADTMSTCS